MKTVMLYVAEDPGLEARCAAILTVVQALGAHLTCVQATPLSAFVLTDPFGGVHPSIDLLSQLEKQQDATRARVDSQFVQAGIHASWVREEGLPARVLLDHSRLKDLLVLSHGSDDERWNQSLELVGDLAGHCRSPVLSVPHTSSKLNLSGNAAIGWNGSFEAAQAVRLAVPLLRLASKVQVLTVTEGDVTADDRAAPASDAVAYLSQHGVPSEILELQRGSHSVSERLLQAWQETNAGYAVLGAYGHSRIRERILGGVTRDMLLRSPVPLLLAH